MDCLTKYLNCKKECLSLAVTITVKIITVNYFVCYQSLSWLFIEFLLGWLWAFFITKLLCHFICRFEAGPHVIFVSFNLHMGSWVVGLACPFLLVKVKLCLEDGNFFFFFFVVLVWLFLTIDTLNLKSCIYRTQSLPDFLPFDWMQSSECKNGTVLIGCLAFCLVIGGLEFH